MLHRRMNDLDVARRPVWSDTAHRPIAAASRNADDRQPCAPSGPSTRPPSSHRRRILVFTWDGIRGRRAPVAIAAGIAIAETMIYGSNNQVCPLTPLAEELGATSGTVTDIYLPAWMSDRIPLLGGSALSRAGVPDRALASVDRLTPVRPGRRSRRRSPAWRPLTRHCRGRAGEGSSGSRSEHDHVGVLGARGLQDRLGRVALPDQERGPNPGFARLRGRSPGRPRPADRAPGRRGGAAARQVEVVWLDHAQDDQGGVLVLGALDRFAGSVARGRRLVDRQQDPRSARRSGFAHLHSLRGTMRARHGPTGPHRPGHAAQRVGNGPGALLPCRA